MGGRCISVLVWLVLFVVVWLIGWFWYQLYQDRPRWLLKGFWDRRSDGQMCRLKPLPSQAQ